MGERVLLELQREVARRVLEQRDILLVEGGTSDGEVARGIQHGAAALRTGLSATRTASNLVEATGHGDMENAPRFPHPQTPHNLWVQSVIYQLTEKRGF